MLRFINLRFYYYWLVLSSSVIIFGKRIDHQVYSTELWNSIVNIRNLINEQYNVLERKQGVSSYLAQYKACYQRKEMGQYGDEIRAEYIFSVEGEQLEFDCGPCAPSIKGLQWRWVTFEGVDTELEPTPKESEDSIYKPIDYQIVGGGQKLLLNSPKPDLSSFYCYWEDHDQANYDASDKRVVTRIWTVEIVSVAHMEKMSARQWQRNFSLERAPYQDLQVASTRIRVSTEWSSWSPCSHCNKVAGKRFKTGFCSVNQISPESLLALKLYKLPISCSLLIDFHPEILADSTALKSFSRMHNLNHVLGRPHSIIVGYCRKRRDCVEQGFKSRNKVIAELFQDFEMVGGGSGEDPGDNGGNWSGRKIVWMLKSLIKGLPIGWNNLPEIVALVGLLALQAYVIYLVCKWKGAAV